MDRIRTRNGSIFSTFPVGCSKRSGCGLKPGVAPGPVQEKLRAAFRAIQEERVKGFPAQSKRDRERFFQEKLSLQPAAAGRSNLQREYRQALFVLGLLVVLVLLIACANV